MVGKIEVIFTSSVIQYLDDLVLVLYRKEYFGFIESAEEYVSNIYKEVPERIKKSPHKKTPKPLQYLGLNYIFYKSNTRTTWYIFFEKSNQNYLITGILNNYSEEAKEL
ncbi:hypothetical protein [Flavobacterium ginsenosidimutans]|uniref:Plasmid stabilization protein n=1 Tax=Flavobacterium ginsenosidimutans TaxID=687844 RepID=A0ABZ2QAS7_9FLAO|nr:hypothetical protein [Flavobacterium ginsenosidimutans]KAF2335298.1 hypothetical protein DM444_04810 [Flavobacterium ginsenosidimutans]